jgi:hypothetical protein
MPQEVEIVFYHSIGRLMNRWGYIDSLFSQICSDLIDGLGHSPKGKAPWGLTERLNFVLDCFEADRRIKNGIDAVKVIVEDVKQIDVHRGYVVHGCMTQYFPEGPEFQFTKLDRSADRYKYEQYSMIITQQQIHQLSDVSTDLIVGLSEIAKLVNFASKL